MKNSKQEYWMAVMLFAAVLSIMDIAYVKSLARVIEQNGMSFSQGGLLKYKDANTGKTLYIPFYMRK